MPEITSIQNARVKAMRAYRDAKTRKQTGVMLVEGEKMLGEARSAGLRVRDVFFDEERVSREIAGSGAVSVSAHILESLCETVTPQGVVAAVEMPKPITADALLARAKTRVLRLVALDGVQDPGNLGTIWRTCDAADFDGMLLSEGCPDPFSPKVLRSSMGAAFRVPVLRVNLPETLLLLREAGTSIISSQLDGKPFFGNVPSGDLAIVIGNEARGVSEEVRQLATHRLKLPMPGKAESLNASVAAGIMIYACLR